MTPKPGAPSSDSDDLIHLGDITKSKMEVFRLPSFFFPLLLQGNTSKRERELCCFCCCSFLWRIKSFHQKWNPFIVNFGTSGPDKTLCPPFFLFFLLLLFLRLFSFLFRTRGTLAISEKKEEDQFRSTNRSRVSAEPVHFHVGQCHAVYRFYASSINAKCSFLSLSLCSNLP